MMNCAEPMRFLRFSLDIVISVTVCSCLVRFLLTGSALSSHRLRSHAH
jgi:hypothetical protein